MPNLLPSTTDFQTQIHTCTQIIIIIMYIDHALINALSTHMIHINLNMIFYTHVEHSPPKTIYIKYYTENNNKKHMHYTHTHTYIYILVAVKTHLSSLLK